MDKVSLFIDAALLIFFGLIANFESYVSAGLALMWIGIAVSKNNTGGQQ